jgi:hypothetical protein
LKSQERIHLAAFIGRSSCQCGIGVLSFEVTNTDWLKTPRRLSGNCATQSTGILRIE